MFKPITWLTTGIHFKQCVVVSIPELLRKKYPSTPTGINSFLTNSSWVRNSEFRGFGFRGYKNVGGNFPFVCVVRNFGKFVKFVHIIIQPQAPIACFL